MSTPQQEHEPQSPQDQLRSLARAASKQYDQHKKTRSQYWLLWLALTVLVAITAVAGGTGTVFGGLVGAALCGAYTYYLYNGGRFVFVPVWLMVVLFLAPFFMIYNTLHGKPTPRSNGGSVGGYNTSPVTVRPQESAQNIDPDLVRQYPITARLPYRTPAFTIDYKLINNEPRFRAIFYPPKAVGPSGSQGYFEWWMRYSAEADDFLKTNGIDPEKTYVDHLDGYTGQ